MHFERNIEFPEAMLIFVLAQINQYISILYGGTVCIRKYYASQLLCFFEIWKTLGSVSKIRKYCVSQILCFSPYYCRGFLTAFPTTVEKCRTASSNFTQTRKCGFNKKLHRCGNEVCSDLHSQTSAARTTLRAV